MKTRRNTLTVVLIGLVVLLSTTVWNVLAGNGVTSSDEYEKSIHWGQDLAWSAEGVWVISAPTPVGPILMLHNNHAQDLTGTRFGGTMLHVNDNPTNFGMFPDVEDGTGWVTQTIRTGPDTFVTTMLMYGTKNRENLPQELATIGIATAEWQVTGPDTKKGQSTFAVYLASQDADGNGFPDEGQEPVACTAFEFTGHRLRVMPGCVPTPLLEPPGQ